MSGFFYSVWEGEGIFFFNQKSQDICNWKHGISRYCREYGLCGNIIHIICFLIIHFFFPVFYADKCSHYAATRCACLLFAILTDHGMIA